MMLHYMKVVYDVSVKYHVPLPGYLQKLGQRYLAKRCRKEKDICFELVIGRMMHKNIGCFLTALSFTHYLHSDENCVLIGNLYFHLYRSLRIRHVKSPILQICMVILNILLFAHICNLHICLFVFFNCC